MYVCEERARAKRVSGRETMREAKRKKREMCIE